MDDANDWTINPRSASTTIRCGPFCPCGLFARRPLFPRRQHPPDASSKPRYRSLTTGSRRFPVRGNPLRKILPETPASTRYSDSRNSAQAGVKWVTSLYKNNVSMAELLTYDWLRHLGPGLNQTITDPFSRRFRNLNACWETRPSRPKRWTRYGVVQQFAFGSASTITTRSFRAT